MSVFQDISVVSLQKHGLFTHISVISLQVIRRLVDSRQGQEPISVDRRTPPFRIIQQGFNFRCREVVMRVAKMTLGLDVALFSDDLA